MISRLFAFILLLGVSYLLLIFSFPSIADQYGDKDINAKIRKYKDQSLQFASGADSPASLFQKVQQTVTPQIQEIKTQVNSLESTVTTKVEQAQEAKAAVENAYSGLIDARQKVQNLTK